MFNKVDIIQITKVIVAAVLNENCPLVGSIICKNLSKAIAQSDQEVTKTAQEFERGTSRHIKGPKAQSFVKAYQGVTGTAVRHKSMSVSIKFKRKRFLVERRLKK